VISAVGHEIDFTISDFVADKRAPTPTGAAMIAVPDINSVKNNVIQLSNRLIKNMNNEIVQNKTKLKHISKKQIFKNPESIYEIKSMSLDNLVSKLNYVSKSIIKDNKTKLSNLENSIIMKNPIEITKSKREACLRNIEKLEILNPLLTLKRGYTLAKSNDKVVSSAKDVKKGDKLDVEFNDGTVNTKVI